MTERLINILRPGTTPFKHNTLVDLSRAAGRRTKVAKTEDQKQESGLRISFSGF